MPTTRFIEILSVQRPFLVPRLDENSRTVYSTNYRARADYPSFKWVECVAVMIEGAGYGPVVIGVAASMTGEGPYIQLIDTGGREPEECQSDEKIERLSLQILLRNADSEACSLLAEDVWRLLDGKRNITVTLP